MARTPTYGNSALEVCIILVYIHLCVRVYSATETVILSGPKNYGYIVRTPSDGQDHYSIKVKGFTLNRSTSQVVNYNALKEMVHAFQQEGDDNQRREVRSKEIQRTADYKIVTAETCKRWQIVYDKRILLDNFETRPYGWQF